MKKYMVRFHGCPLNMSEKGETFFTSVGCMDGRVQEPVADFGRKKFGAKYPDTITEAGLVGVLSKPSQTWSKQNVDNNLIKCLKKKILISLEKHHSKGIIIHGHEECAGNPVSDQRHKEDVKKSVRVIQSLINSSVPVFGAFVKRSSEEPSKWKIEEV